MKNVRKNLGGVRLIRMIGLAFIMIISVSLGTFFGKVYGFRVEDLKSFKRAMIILKSEIEYMGTPLYQALNNIGDKLKGSPVSNIFYDFGEQLQEHVSPDIALQNSLNKYKEKIYILPDDKSNIISFGKTVGYLDKELQINNIDLILSYLNERIEEETKHYIKYKKLYQTLGILAGLLIVIILV